MKIKCVFGCFVFLMALAVNASAQLVAGTPVDKLYQQITAADNPEQRMELCLQFEREFPDSPVLVDIYAFLMDIHNQKNETVEAIEYGEKTIQLDPEHVTALMSVARNLSVARQELPKAVQYAERAVSAVEKMKTDNRPGQYTEEQWQQYLESTEAAARNILSYAQTVSP